MDKDAIMRFFVQAADLTAVCTQNGWPDPDSLRVEILQQRAGELLCEVRFDEVVMEGSGCCAARVGCWGQYRVELDAAGRIARAEAVTGARA
ncbi:MAG: hypothetical protein M0039_04520 [Pseudomonadota bacterium]|nr:hypothetical protein [Pseudomonadota bacterium]